MQTSRIFLFRIKWIFFLNTLGIFSEFASDFENTGFGMKFRLQLFAQLLRKCWSVVWNFITKTYPKFATLGSFLEKKKQNGTKNLSNSYEIENFTSDIFACTTSRKGFIRLECSKKLICHKRNFLEVGILKNIP